ncbi:endonuclease/exonuclease/phosphatase family protein [Halorubrum sp. Atlit-8R]|uniref:endonuclease/exonuclease/phosphatase family protein n=1 Tax=unclassified Halorubrum TaxID=2642239 RepID=UPI000EF1F04D|nr:MULTISPECIES: endonuclease/exonuclease/phosphatase family protein [unclassified Halorubrum]RLM68098.1 endonuclease/exonuclease/phosphatase family protein [Halorubrum sp. Atlit-9R]RLM81327.1 endonuclease/exonuclease/phosphatase family protein [Halorubrum sp. Atlit-8R]
MPRDTSRRSVLKAIGATAAVPGIVGTAAGRGNAPTPRYAAFNVVDLGTEQVQEPGDSQAEAAARVIQEVDPDVLVVNELVNNIQEATVDDGVPTAQTNIEAFVDNYLSEPQAPHLDGIDYEYTLQPESNTGLLPEEDYDFNKDGAFGRPGDAFGFGFYPGQYAFGIASKFPFDEGAIRSFREFLWADMPGNLIPVKGQDDVDTDDIYLVEEELDAFRLSSKTHIDVPFDVDGETVHGLFSHPTPTVFDGDNNFNGRWNHDENRFWADYVAGEDYIYDDAGTHGGLDDDASYVLLGDMNAGPGDEPLDPATKYFVDNDDFNSRSLPTSPGGATLGNQYATADFGGDGSKVDWVLPSPDLSKRASSVVWPNPNANKRGLADDAVAASDHRLVWADVAVTPGNGGGNGGGRGKGRGRGNR